MWAGTTVPRALSESKRRYDVIAMLTMGVRVVFGELDCSGQSLLSLVCEVEV